MWIVLNVDAVMSKHLDDNFALWNCNFFRSSIVGLPWRGFHSLRAREICADP